LPRSQGSLRRDSSGSHSKKITDDDHDTAIDHYNLARAHIAGGKKKLAVKSGLLW